MWWIPRLASSGLNTYDAFSVYDFYILKWEGLALKWLWHCLIIGTTYSTVRFKFKIDRPFTWMDWVVFHLIKFCFTGNSTSRRFFLCICFLKKHQFASFILQNSEHSCYMSHMSVHYSQWMINRAGRIK